MVKECQRPITCFYCKNKNHHNSALCPKQFGSENVHVAAENNEPNETDNSTEKVIMKTAKVKTLNPTVPEKVYARMLLDSGSQRTYITKKLAKVLKLKTTKGEKLSVSTFNTDETKSDA